MAKKRHISQPSLEDEQELLSLIDAESDSVKIRDKEYSFGMLCGHAQHKITQILLKKKTDERQVSCKCVAAAWLNGFFSIRFLWWIVWRWLYYIRQYSDDELTEAITLIKKKVPFRAYLVNTTLLIGMRETMMQMNRNEVFLSLREQSGDKDGKSARNANG